MGLLSVGRGDSNDETDQSSMVKGGASSHTPAQILGIEDEWSRYIAQQNQERKITRKKGLYTVQYNSPIARRLMGGLASIPRKKHF